MESAVTAHAKGTVQLKLDQMTKKKQTKARERLKDKSSNFGTYTYKQCFKISGFIIALSFKIKIFLMLMATHFYKMMF